MDINNKTSQIEHFNNPGNHKIQGLLMENHFFNLRVTYSQEYMYGAYGMYRFLIVLKKGPPDPLRPQTPFSHAFL